MKRVLMVCTGNTCRSVMAEALFRVLAEKKDLATQVESAGTIALPGDPPASQAETVVAEFGGDVSKHRSRRLNHYMIDQADVVLAMTAQHRQQILAIAPEAKDKVFVLKEYANVAVSPRADIADPFGQSVERYREVAHELEQAIVRIIDKISKEGMHQVKKLAIGCDHGAFRLKQDIIQDLTTKGYDVEDFGTYSEESCDYPDIAQPLAEQVVAGKFAKGILLCGTGIGMSIAANKVSGIRAALAHDVYSAKMTRAHNDSNILCMGARVIGPGHALEIVDAWLNTEFEGKHHTIRVEKLAKLETDK